MRNNDSYNIYDNGDEYDDLSVIPASTSSNNGEVVEKFTIILWYIPEKNQYSTPASTDSFDNDSLHRTFVLNWICAIFNLTSFQIDNKNRGVGNISIPSSSSF